MKRWQWTKAVVTAGALGAVAATAQIVEGPNIPGPGFPPGGIPGTVVDPRLATKAFFDCAPGPGYLVFRIVDPSGHKYTETDFMGSRDKCLRQAKDLWRTRGTITEASTVALCVTGGGPWFLRRRVVYPVGQGWNGYLTAGLVQKLSDQEYPSLKECLEYAADLNGSAVQLPPPGDGPGTP